MLTMRKRSILCMIILVFACVLLCRTKSQVFDNKDFIERVLYADITGFGTLSDQERKFIEKDYPKKTSTYGEISYDSAQQLLADSDINFGKNDVFYDLGSGVGKLVVQVYLNTPVAKSVGIELSPTRHKRTQRIADRLKKYNKIDNDRVISFLEGDFLEADLSDATIIFICSTCYAPTLLEQLVSKFSKLKKGLRVISLKELPDYQKYNFKLIKEYRLPMTWSKQKGSVVFVYRLQ